MHRPVWGDSRHAFRHASWPAGPLPHADQPGPDGPGLQCQPRTFPVRGNAAAAGQPAFARWEWEAAAHHHRCPASVRSRSGGGCGPPTRRAPRPRGSAVWKPRGAQRPGGSAAQARPQCGCDSGHRSCGPAEEAAAVKASLPRRFSAENAGHAGVVRARQHNLFRTQALDHSGPACQAHWQTPVFRDSSCRSL